MWLFLLRVRPKGLSSIGKVGIRFSEEALIFFLLAPQWDTFKTSQIVFTNAQSIIPSVDTCINA